ncbi:hypothetical protein DPMN_024777 [Dreissena polymorpha]|uniref:Uncharacterized protein n=1 Tax=Dreissena polymorpha TaxID=45954 RepID=A0A9D4RB26_DREPO|nr:hypothetical protein DPMN_024777 [Dreissena polymorpha]
MKPVATLYRLSKQTGGDRVFFMVQLHKLDRKYNAAEKKVNQEISRLSERLQAVTEVKPTVHVTQFSLERTINPNFSNYEGLESTPVTGHIKAPILHLKINDERGIEYPDGADDKKRDLHKHRRMPYPICLSQEGINYPERTYYQ